VVWAGTIGAVLGPNLLYISDALGESFGLPDMGGPYVVAAVAIAIGAIIIYVRLKPDPYLIATTKSHGSQQVPSRHKLGDAVAQLKDKPRAILGIASLAIAMAVLVMLTVTVPARMLDSGISLQIIGLIVSINIAGMYLLSPVVGWLVDYFGRVPMITVGVMISAFACILSGLTSAEATTVLALGQFLLGLGWSCTMISGATLLTDEVSPINRPAVQGFSDLLVNISSAVGGITAGLLILTASFEILCAVALVPLIGITVVISIPACRRHSASSSL
jgi:MFS family permease